MTRARRRRPRPGSYLPALDAAGMIGESGDLAELHAKLTRMGYRLTKTVRPYLTKRLKLTVRVVWRKREAGRTSTYTHHQSIPLSDIRSARADGSL